METPDRFYSRRSLLIKAVYGVALVVMQLLITSGEAGANFLWLLMSIVLLGCLYTVPFWMTLKALRKTKRVPLRSYIAKDALYTLLPPIAFALLYEICIAVFVSYEKQTGLYTLLLSLILSLITGVFWLLYRFAGKK